jgi:acyl-CoA thioester hydrolase
MATAARSRTLDAAEPLPGPYDYQVRVGPEAIDHIGHVNNAIYLQWTQAAVIGHWERLADPEAIARHLWVALEHKITYRRPAFCGDGVVASVRLESAAGAKARFRTLIRRGQELLAEVDSLWCSIDRISRRPVRLPQQTLARFIALDV